MNRMMPIVYAYIRPACISISLKPYICTRCLFLHFAVLDKFIFCRSLFSIINTYYSQGKEMCSAPCIRILQGSENQSARIGLALSVFEQAMDENGGLARLNDIAACPFPLPSRRQLANHSKINNRSGIASLSHTQTPTTFMHIIWVQRLSFRCHLLLPNSCNRPIDDHDLILAIISTPAPSYHMRAIDSWLHFGEAQSHRAAFCWTRQEN
jgi:hypothetical protein